MFNRFTFYQQPDEMDCGPACLKMIAKFYGKSISIRRLRALTATTREGTSLSSMAQAGEKIGFRTVGVKISLNSLINEAPLPCIVFWNQRHYVIVYKISKNKIFIADPGYGLMTYTKREFISNWIGDITDYDVNEGVALLFEQSQQKVTTNFESFTENDFSSFSFLWGYLINYRKFFVQLFLGVLGLFLAILPFEQRLCKAL